MIILMMLVVTMTVRITCSFGVAEYIPGESAADFITRADDALYRAKANGRNQVQMTPQPARHAA